MPLSPATRIAMETTTTITCRVPGRKPDYFTTDFRLSRQFALSDRLRMDCWQNHLMSPNRDNKRVQITDDGFVNAAGVFVPYNTTVKGKQYPAYFQSSSTFFTPNNSAYPPRQCNLESVSSFDPLNGRFNPEFSCFKVRIGHSYA